jgi:hypothetical protein
MAVAPAERPIVKAEVISRMEHARNIIGYILDGKLPYSDLAGVIRLLEQAQRHLEVSELEEAK